MLAGETVSVPFLPLVPVLQQSETWGEVRQLNPRLSVALTPGNSRKPRIS